MIHLIIIIQNLLHQNMNKLIMIKVVDQVLDYLNYNNTKNNVYNIQIHHKEVILIKIIFKIENL